MKTKKVNKADITGEKFGMLTAVRPSEETDQHGSILWECICECGNKTFASVSSLRKGNKKSCGCLKIKAQADLNGRLTYIDGTCIEWLTERRIRKDNKTGHAGVFLRKGKYVAYIGFQKKIYFLGVYENLEDAVQARKDAEQVHHKFAEAYKNWKKENEGKTETKPFAYTVIKTGAKLQLIVGDEKRKP